MEEARFMLFPPIELQGFEVVTVCISQIHHFEV